MTIVIHFLSSFSQKKTPKNPLESGHRWYGLCSRGKVHKFSEGHKILRNLHLTFVCSTYSQTFCGLFRIYELYLHHRNAKLFFNPAKIDNFKYEKISDYKTVSFSQMD